MSFWDPSHIEPFAVSVASSYRLEDGLQTLTGKQRFVIELRFGLRDGEVYTQDEIAEAMGITRQAVGAIETDALTRLTDS